MAMAGLEQRLARLVADMPPEQTERLRRWRDGAARRIAAAIAPIDRLLARDAAFAVAVIAVIALQIALAVTHRPWLDEWQALQIAVQSPTLGDLAQNLRYEGHPPLWYWILRTVAAPLHDPLWALPVTVLLVGIPAQLTILFAAPFSRSERVLISLSEFVLFEFLTLSRSLSLGFALMIAVAALWRTRRLVWIPIALLPLCDFLFGVSSVIFAVLRWRERRLAWDMVPLWLASGLFAAWSIRPMPDIHSALLPNAFWLDLTAWMAGSSTLGLPLQWHLLHPRWNSPPPLGLSGPALLCFVSLVVVELRRRRDFLIAQLAFLALTLVFSVAVYQLSIRHLMNGATLLIVLVWINAAQGAPDRSVWWRGWLLVAALCGLFNAALAFAKPFDTTFEAVAMIRNLGLANKEWVAFPHSAGQGLAAVNAMQIERLAENCTEDFVRWNSPDEHQVKSIDDLSLRLHRKADADGRFYLITWYHLPENPPFLRRVGVVRAGYDGLDFVMYAVGTGAREGTVHAPPCAGPHPALRPASR